MRRLLCSCRRRGAIIAATAALIVLQSSGIRAHDMPSDVLVQMFVRPSANHLQVLVRLPLISLLNINLPKRGEDFLDLAAIEPSLRDAAKATADAVDFFAADNKLTEPRTLAVRVSLPSDTSFTSYQAALAHLQSAPLPVDTEVVWNQGFFDAMLEYDGLTTDSQLALHPYFTMLAPRVVTSVHVQLADGRTRSFELNNNPGLVHLDPRWYQTAWTFTTEGLMQVLSGPEHLLFLIALAIPVRRVRPLFPAAIALAVASSLTLMASAFQFAPSGAWFQPMIAALAAVGIVAMTIDNVFIADRGHRWAVAFGFGLAFGFALCFSLRPTMQLAGSHVVTSVVAFTAGVVFGQLLVLAILIPALTGLFRLAVSERVGVIVLSALVGHTAWHWMISRITFLTTINWPLSDLIEVMRWSAAVTLVAASAVLLVGFGRRLHLAERFSVHSTPS